MRQRSQRNSRRFGARWAVRFLSGSAPELFVRALQLNPDRPLVLHVPRYLMALDPMVKRAVTQLGGARAPGHDAYRVFVRGADL